MSWKREVDELRRRMQLATAMGGPERVVFPHFSVMPRGTGQLFVAGPPFVLRGLGQEVDKEQLDSRSRGMRP